MATALQAEPPAYRTDGDLFVDVIHPPHGCDCLWRRGSKFEDERTIRPLEERRRKTQSWKDLREVLKSLFFAWFVVGQLAIAVAAKKEKTNRGGAAGGF